MTHITVLLATVALLILLWASAVYVRRVDQTHILRRKRLEIDRAFRKANTAFLNRDRVAHTAARIEHSRLVDEWTKLADEFERRPWWSIK